MKICQNCCQKVVLDNDSLYEVCFDCFDKYLSEVLDYSSLCHFENQQILDLLDKEE